MSTGPHGYRSLFRSSESTIRSSRDWTFTQLLIDSRWTAFRWVFQAQIFSLVFIIGALAIARANLDRARPVAPVVVGGLALSLVAYVAFYLYCERGTRLAARAT